MSLADRGVYLRNYVMGVLAVFAGKELNSENLPTLANEITQAVLEGEQLWNEAKCNEEIRSIRAIMDEDVPQ